MLRCRNAPLQREIGVVIGGADKYGTIQGTVIHPAGNIAMELLRSGACARSRGARGGLSFTHAPFEPGLARVDDWCACARCARRIALVNSVQDDGVRAPRRARCHALGRADRQGRPRR